MKLWIYAKIYFKIHVTDCNVKVMLLPDKQMASAIKNQKIQKKDRDQLWNDFREWLQLPLGTFSNYHHKESLQTLIDNYSYEFPVEVVNYHIAKKQMLVDEFVYNKFIHNEKIKNDYKYYLGIHSRLKGLELTKQENDEKITEIIVNANINADSGVYSAAKTETKNKKSKEQEKNLKLF
jgi:hypothetical protein